MRIALPRVELVISSREMFASCRQTATMRQAHQSRAVRDLARAGSRACGAVVEQWYQRSTNHCAASKACRCVGKAAARQTAGRVCSNLRREQQHFQEETEGEDDKDSDFSPTTTRYLDRAMLLRTRRGRGGCGDGEGR